MRSMSSIRSMSTSSMNMSNMSSMSISSMSMSSMSIRSMSMSSSSQSRSSQSGASKRQGLGKLQGPARPGPGGPPGRAGFLLLSGLQVILPWALQAARLVVVVHLFRCTCTSTSRHCARLLTYLVSDKRLVKANVCTPDSRQVACRWGWLVLVLQTCVA